MQSLMHFLRIYCFIQKQNTDQTRVSAAKYDTIPPMSGLKMDIAAATTLRRDTVTTTTAINRCHPLQLEVFENTRKVSSQILVNGDGNEFWYSKTDGRLSQQ